MASIADCKVDQEFRGLIPVATADERHDLAENVRQFGFLSPIVVWRNERDELVVLDGHARLQLHRDAVARPEGAGLAFNPPGVVELDLPSRDDARLWIINNQLARRNLGLVDRIELVRHREAILRQKAKQKQSAAGKQTMSGKLLGSTLSVNLPKAEERLDTRKELADLANVSEKTYSDATKVLDAVDGGELPASVLDEIRAGKQSVSGVAKTLKATPDGKPKRSAKGKGKGKASRWQSIVNGFTAAVRRFIKRDPQRRAEIAAELRRLADEFESAEKAAA